MPAAVWLPAEGPNLVGFIFKEGEAEDMQRKTERIGYLESELLYCTVCRTANTLIYVFSLYCMCQYICVHAGTYSMCLVLGGTYI